MKTLFTSLIRFEDPHGEVHFGEAGQDVEGLVGHTVPLYEGTTPWDLRTSGKTAQVAKVLSPVSQDSTSLIYGIGLNYRTHLAETGFRTPKYPVYFSKPPDALAGPFDDIPIPKCVRNLDYEAELCFVIGTDCKDLGEDDDSVQVILGFMNGNDVSGREWQTQEAAGGQHHVAKSFDKFAPVGPVLASWEAVANPDNLTIETRVDGQVRQKGHTSDFLFSLSVVLANLTRGKTLRKGTIVMTGTPGGVAFFMKPQAWVKDGEVVEVSISGLGTLRNKHVYEC